MERVSPREDGSVPSSPNPNETRLFFMSIALHPPATLDGPRPRYPFAHALRFGYDPLGMIEDLDAWGEIPFFRVGPRGAVLVNTPEAVQQVLVTQHESFRKGLFSQEARRFFLGNGLLVSEGPFHRLQRKRMTPSFSRKRVPEYAAVMVREAAAQSAAWQSGAVIDVERAMMRLTLAIAGDTLLGIDLRPRADRIGRSLADVTNLTYRIGNPMQYPLGPLPLHSNWRFTRGYHRLHWGVWRIVRARIKRGDGDDLLGLLLSMRDDPEAPLTEKQVRDEVMTMLLAAHDTTAAALAWTWHLLAQHPEAEARLHAEVDAVLGDGPATAEHLGALPYTRAVLAESMRLYPPVYLIDREPIEDVEVAGRVIPKRTQLILSAYAIQRSARHWERPLVFDPDRWTTGAGAAKDRPKYAYFPFGGGPRVCIGEHFAWMEVVLVLATLARRWRMEAVPERRVAIHPRITLSTRDGLWMRLKAR